MQILSEDGLGTCWKLLHANKLIKTVLNMNSLLIPKKILHKKQSNSETSSPTEWAWIVLTLKYSAC